MASLNNQIVNEEITGSDASTLKDQRGNLLSKITSLIDVNYNEQSDGSLYVYLPTNGKALVQGGNSWQLQVQKNVSNDNLNDIVFQDDPTQEIKCCHLILIS